LREVESRLADWLIRLRLRDAVLWSVRGLAAGLILGLALSVLARLRPLLPVAALLGLGMALALVGFGMALALAYFWPRPKLSAARYFDRLFGLKERTSTAVELAQVRTAVPGWLRRDQWADAAAAARRVTPARHLPIRVDRRDLLAVVVAAAALGASLYLPNPQQAILAEQIAVEQAIAEQIETLEEAREAMGSTGIGDGIAIPHVRNPVVLHVDQPFVTLCLLRHPVDFDAPDGQPVHALFLVVSLTVPAHLRMLAQLGFVLRDEPLRQLLRAAAPIEAILGRVGFVEGSLRSGSYPAGKRSS